MRDPSQPLVQLIIGAVMKLSPCSCSEPHIIARGVADLGLGLEQLLPEDQHGAVLVGDRVLVAGGRRKTALDDRLVEARRDPRP